MADIIINDKKALKGKISITRTANFNNNPVTLEIVGRLSTHKYIEEINTIETERLLLKGVQVYQESFGSEDFNIIYDFTALVLDIKGGESIYSDEEIKRIEDELY